MFGKGQGVGCNKVVLFGKRDGVGSIKGLLREGRRWEVPLLGKRWGWEAYPRNTADLVKRLTPMHPTDHMFIAGPFWE